MKLVQTGSNLLNKIGSNWFKLVENEACTMTGNGNFVNLLVQLVKKLDLIFLFFIFQVLNVAGIKENLVMLVKNSCFTPSRMVTLIFPILSGETSLVRLKTSFPSSW